ncbi:hypothetical protein D9M71_631170 [compost metagenome]
MRRHRPPKPRASRHCHEGFRPAVRRTRRHDIEQRQAGGDARVFCSGRAGRCRVGGVLSVRRTPQAISAGARPAGVGSRVFRAFGVAVRRKLPGGGRPGGNDFPGVARIALSLQRRIGGMDRRKTAAIARRIPAGARRTPARSLVATGPPRPDALHQTDHRQFSRRRLQVAGNPRPGSDGAAR